MKWFFVIFVAGFLVACSSEPPVSEKVPTFQGDATLSGGTWQLVQYKDPEDGWTEVLEGTGYTLTFTEAKMSLIGTLDCNSFYTHYDHTESELKVFDFSPTFMACPFLQNSENEMRALYLIQRKQIYTALKGSNSYLIEDPTLELSCDNGAVLQYRLSGTN